MKKIFFFFWLMYYVFISFVFAQNLVISTGDFWSEIELKDDINKISIWNWLQSIKIDSSIDPILSWVNVEGNFIFLKCNNWIFTKIDWNNIFYNWDLYLLVKDNSGNYLDKYVVVKCYTPFRIIKNIMNFTELNYSSIVSKEDSFSEKYPLTIDWNVDLSGSDAPSKLIPLKDINNQPSFVDIIFLQFKTISNLVDSILYLKPDVKLSTLIDTGSISLNDYNIWLNKFKKYDTKKWFIDSFTWSITLKDIGIAQEIINWLYKCLNDSKNNSCDKIIKFSHSILNKYDVYSLKEIGKMAYLSTGSIVDSSIIYTHKLKDICKDTLNYIWDDFLRTQTSNLCNRLFKKNISNISESIDFDLWYGLGKRIENLIYLKNIAKKNSFNLKWLYNLYWELTNLSVWSLKASMLSQIKNMSDDQAKYKVVSNVIEKDKKEIEEKSEIINTDNMDIILNSEEELLDPNSTAHKDLLDANPNINIFNNANYEVTNSVVKVAWLTVLVFPGKEFEWNLSKEKLIYWDDDDNILVKWNILNIWDKVKLWKWDDVFIVTWSVNRIRELKAWKWDDIIKIDKDYNWKEVKLWEWNDNFLISWSILWINKLSLWKWENSVNVANNANIWKLNGGNSKDIMNIWWDLDWWWEIKLWKWDDVLKVWWSVDTKKINMWEWNDILILSWVINISKIKMGKWNDILKICNNISYLEKIDMWDGDNKIYVKSSNIKNYIKNKIKWVLLDNVIVDTDLNCN
jgi:hypothetical protein